MDLKRRIKSVLGWFLFRSGLHRRLLNDRGTVVLFHRVDDRYPTDPITCPTRDFEAYCRFFSRYFEAIELDELVEHLELDRKLPPASLCITFDDGYRDNRLSAAPILIRHGLPCTFFIATDFIDSDRMPWWDRDQGIESEWMTSKHLQELVESGFGIGAHTVSHADLGQVHGVEARREIQESRAALESRLGIKIEHFSYPFGRRDQMTEANLSLVRSLGFRSCLSAFGGRVTGGTDPFRIPRVPVSPWYRSPYHLGWELLFGNR